MVMILQQPKDGGPLLTIAIPTYNRADCLKLLLSELAKQIPGDSVELIISDNASPDNTPEVVEHFASQGMIFRYTRNNVNVGGDANFLQCYEMAQGEYFWIVGDDDVIVPGGLKRILSILEKRKYDLINVSSYAYHDEYCPRPEPKSWKKLTEFPSATAFALRVSTGLTFISGNIIRKGKLETKQHSDFSKQVGTNLMQLSWIFTLLSREPKCAFLPDRMVACKAMLPEAEHGTCQVFGRNMQSMVQQFLGVDSKTGRAILNRTIQLWFPWAIVHGRLGNTPFHLVEDPRAILGEVFGSNFRYWVFLWPTICLPLPLARAWLFMLRVTAKIDQAFGYPIARFTLKSARVPRGK